MGDLGLILASAGALLVLLLLLLLALTRMYQRVDRSEALIISSGRGARVSFTGALVVPLLHHAERISLAVHPIVIDRRGADGFVCRDKIRAELRLCFLVRVNRTTEDMLVVAASVGSARASDPAVLHALFVGKFTDAAATLVSRLNFEELHLRRDEFRDELITAIGRDLHGFVLDDVAVEHLQHTPLAALDPNNLFDAEGIRKLTEQTSRHNLAAHELRREQATRIAHQDLIADEQLLRIERQRAEAEAHQQSALAGLNLPPPAGR